MAKQSYYELLRDPRWQRKRLEIMERADFTCEECGDKSATLEVHHGYYKFGNAPWEYPSSSLACLCGPCHEKRGDELWLIRRMLATLNSEELDIISGYILVVVSRRQAVAAPPELKQMIDQALSVIADAGRSQPHAIKQGQ